MTTRQLFEYPPPENNYISRASYRDKQDDLDQEKLSQHQK